MKRRDFIAALAGAVVAPHATRAQQAMPVVGFLNPTSAAGYPHVIAAFRRGLAEQGFVEGQNVKIEYRWADGQPDRLPALAADFVHRQVSVIAATGGGAAAFAGKRATTTIPVVFNSADDPVRSGLVDSFNRPGGNLTGVSMITTELMPKRVELLAEVVPKANVIAFLINPADNLTDARIRDVQKAAQSLGRKVQVLKANTEREIDATFAGLGQADIGAMLILNDSLFNARSEQLGALSVRYGIPAIYQNREFATAGGLMSYGPSLPEAYRVVGQYVGRILKGEKPGDLPVQQQSKVDFYLNMKTARALGLTVPLPVVALTDEVIE
jgi:putative ABC transport system substrate-binding protein